jgi:ubiquinone/menaquinone biosynthesis C-methylase UbiE
MKRGRSVGRTEWIPNWAYRLAIWAFKVQDLLGINKPETHLGAVPLRSGMVVVDWGCGPGRFTSPLSRLVGKEGKVFALDIQTMAIQVVAEKVARESLANVEPLLIDSYRTPISTGSVDLVLLLDTFFAIDDVGALLTEIHRILKADGHLFMDPGHMKLETALAKVTGSGLFTLVERHGTDMLMAPTSLARPRPR